MSPSKGIVWLSSYPKSGNTWFRIFLSCVLNQTDTLHPIQDIDAILGSPMLANRMWMNETLGFDSTLLTADELDALRPMIYEWYAAQRTQTVYVKTHDAYTYVTGNRPLFPREGCLKAVYIIRNPLDIAISMAHHVQYPIDWVIQMMSNDTFAMPLDLNDSKQIRQKLLSWSAHVHSWCQQSAISTLVLRYEDLFFEPIKTFRKAVDFLNIDVSQERLCHAIEQASFPKLQQHESAFGFKEKPSQERAFFRKGIVGDWEKTLAPGQVEKIMQDHRFMMRAYGYAK